MKNQQKIKLAFFIFTGLLVGFLTVLQFRSFDEVQTLLLRERNPDIFHDIKILKQVTDSLNTEIANLYTKKQELSKATSSFQAFSEKKQQYELLVGEAAVSGKGIALILSDTLPTFWFTDLVNELATAGAEAIAVNGLRLTAKHSGFTVLPPYTLLVGESVFYPPFTIEAVGDQEALYSVLLQTGGFIERLEKSQKHVDIQLLKKNTIILRPQ